jgi:flagellar motility protein MotE (MotC chaperone)
MIAKLQSPIAAAVLGLVLSVGVGVYLSFRVLGTMLQAPVAVAEKAVPIELTQRGWDFWTIEIDNLSTELREERARLRKQSELLDQRIARAVAEEKELAKVRADIERLRKEISDKVLEISADEAKNLRSLAQTYASLSPRAAMAIIKEIDESTAVKVLSLMKTDVVGPIFEEMAKGGGADGGLARKAAMLSEKLRMMKASKTAPPS